MRSIILNIRSAYVWPEQNRRAYVTMLKRARGNLIDELWLCNFRTTFLRHQIERMSETDQRRCIRLATYIDDDCHPNLVIPLTAKVAQAKRLFVDQYGRPVRFRTLESQLKLAEATKEALANERRWACRHTRALSDNPQPGDLLEMIEMSRSDYRFVTRRELLLRDWSHNQIRFLKPDRQDKYRRPLYSLNQVQILERKRDHVSPPTRKPDGCLDLVAWRMELD